MAYDALIETLREEGKTKSATILRNARTEAERLLADAKQQCEALDREVDSVIHGELSTQRVTVLTRAALSRRRLMLQAKQEVVEAVWRHARQTALALTGQARTTILVGLLDEALGASSCASPRLVLDGRERPYLERILQERNLSVEPQQRDDLLLGLTLEGNGEMITNSFAARLAKAMPDLLIELNRLLFAEQPSEPQRPKTGADDHG